MTTIPFQELVDFIQSQPDDKEINMKQNKGNADCGCILVQFARNKQLSDIATGWTILGSGVQIEETDDKCKKLISLAFRSRITTFKQAKELLTRLNLLPS